MLKENIGMVLIVDNSGTTIFRNIFL